MLPVIAMVLMNPVTIPANASVTVVDEKATADLYAAKCKMCHGDKAQKLFVTADKTDAQLIEIVLKGKKGEKPPFMPAYEAKGVDATQAEALVCYMKTLKQ
jgi:mono/diheme cytochrome c family protein